MAQTMTGTAHMATTTLRVEGMTCGACTSAVEGGFRGVDGVGSVSVSLVMERAVVQHDPDLISPENVKEIIEDRGFDAEVLATDIRFPVQEDAVEEEMLQDSDGPDRQISITTLAVNSMTCGQCTSAIESAFRDVQGIESFSISLLSERAVVGHIASIITPEAIAEIIEGRGYGVTIVGTTGPPVRTTEQHRKIRQPEMALTTTTVSIEGMTCGACTSAVESGFQGVEGMVQFNISLLAERAVITHDATKLSAEQIVEIIDDRGFEAKLLSSQQKATEYSATSAVIRLRLFGLRDTVATTELEAQINQIPGITSCTITFSMSRASVSYNPSRIGLRAIVEAFKNQDYDALLAESDDNNAQLESLAKTREIQDWRRSFQISLSLAIPVFLISMIIPMYIPILDFSSIRLIPGLYLGDVVCLILTLPVQFGIGKRFYISAYKSLRHKSPTMDVLVVLGTSAAFFFSVAAMTVSILSPRHTRPSTVFDTSSMLITFITLGRYLENRAKGQTSKALSRLMSLAPSRATIYADPIAAEKAAEEWEANSVADSKGPLADTTRNAAAEQIIATELLQVGDIVVLRPGDKIPADGTVTQGQSYVDESMVTGEAMPIPKHKGSNLMAGTVNGAGRVDFRVTRAGRDTQLSQIVKLVQEAQTSRAPIQRMADVIAGYFVPIIIALGFFTFISWMVLSHVLSHPPQVFLEPESGGRLMVCMKLCISVIVFACPCALGLSTPTAVMVGTGIGATNGILVKGGAALETATKTTHVVFDKTGTLTMGKMSVAEANMEPLWKSLEWRRRLWWTLIGLTEMSTEHPIGKAIINAAKEELGISSAGMIDGSIGDFQATVGQGVCALVEPASAVDRTRYRVHIGNDAYLLSQGIALPTEYTTKSTSNHRSLSLPSITITKAPAGSTLIFAAIDSHFAGTLFISDSLKPTARATILALSRMHISCSLVTGDQLPTANHIASLVGIPAGNIHAGVSPNQKQAIIKDLQSRGEIVAMVGDGINDSPALATANIGIALSSGTDVAMEAADIVIMRPEDLLHVAAALSLARTIFTRIKLNLGWACLYNVIGLPFAMGIGLVLPGGFMLPPMAAGAAMAMSSVSVVGSSLLLKFWRRPGWMTVEGLEGREDEGKMVAVGAEEDGDEDWDGGEGLVDMRPAARSGKRRGGREGVWGRIGRGLRGVMGMGRGRGEAAYVPLADVQSARAEAFGDI